MKLLDSDPIMIYSKVISSRCDIMPQSVQSDGIMTSQRLERSHQLKCIYIMAPLVHVGPNGNEIPTGSPD